MEDIVEAVVFAVKEFVDGEDDCGRVGANGSHLDGRYDGVDIVFADRASNSCIALNERCHSLLAYDNSLLFLVPLKANGLVLVVDAFVDSALIEFLGHLLQAVDNKELTSEQ